MRNITAAEAKSIKKPGMYRAGDTLYLRVGFSGNSKSWVQRLAINGVRRDIGLGSFSLVRLAEAREKAHENRRAARIEKRDIIAEKRRAAAPTFSEAAERFHEANKPRWRAEKHAKNWIQIVSKYALPMIGERRLDSIEREDVLRILTPIWTAKAETAKKLRQNIRAVFSWAQAHGYIEHNPAGEAIDGALPRMPKVKANFRALPYAEITEALETIEASGASMSAKLALRFLILTAARSGEVRGATWGEIDLDARTWTLPAERTKSNREHRQPLSDEAVAVLEQARALSGGEGAVFPSPMKPGNPLSDMTLTKILRDTGLAERAVVHGFRTSFRTWASEETNADHAVMELALSHQVGSEVERAYARSDLFAKRARLMGQWGRFVAGSKAGKVVAIR